MTIDILDISYRVRGIDRYIIGNLGFLGIGHGYGVVRHLVAEVAIVPECVMCHSASDLGVNTAYVNRRGSKVVYHPTAELAGAVDILVVDPKSYREGMCVVTASHNGTIW